MRLYVVFVLFALVTALLIPISASAQTDAECLGVYDAFNDRVGRADSIGQRMEVLFSDQGHAAQLEVSRESLLGDDQQGVWFSGADCTGDIYMTQKEDLIQIAYLDGNDLWYPDTKATPVLFAATSVFDDGTCYSESRLLPLVPGFHSTVSFTPPFHVELEPCYTPDPTVAALTPYSLGAMALVLAFGAYLTMRRQRVS
jgi:hypothetical protein